MMAVEGGDEEKRTGEAVLLPVRGRCATVTDWVRRWCRERSLIGLFPVPIGARILLRYMSGCPFW